jgi:hypothetical protein
MQQRLLWHQPILIRFWPVADDTLRLGRRRRS